MESEFTVTYLEVITLFAVFFGPIVAVQVSQFLDRKRQKRAGKEWIFKTLMRTRAAALTPSHVEALNMIDVEFFGTKKSDKAVVAAWKLYLDNLADTTTPEDIRNSKRNDLFIELLYKMSSSLGYDFDKEHIKNTCYFPQGYVDVENEQHLIRKGVLGILKGDLVVPMHVTNIPAPKPSNQEVNEV
ncbi:DUF6680 family protein [Endozoicomonas sp. GU-1]|uniref:DUF6680 family protein n=1 Tax=Endozoicomonas sp. GU-1 TaxID=3009078 RepID=UPI0022B3431E|nr:DUF6680 family protein [Endozoicomonas sp. GU-1]WBA81953.1 hypothetical protein O2T12_01935 [Endozoicomonas sp. GU-1]WBA84903.1 hypothetical protein O3276_16715 [Endozoicomonas sp. GU-1]